MCISAVSALLLHSQIKFDILMSKMFSVSITESIVSGLAKEGVKYSELPRLAIRTGQKNAGDNCEVFGKQEILGATYC